MLTLIADTYSIANYETKNNCPHWHYPLTLTLFFERSEYSVPGLPG